MIIIIHTHGVHPCTPRFRCSNKRVLEYRICSHSQLIKMVNGIFNLQNVIHSSSDGRVDKTRSGRRLCRQCCGIKTAAASANAAAPYPKANTPVCQ